MFCKKGVLRNFTTFTRKHLCQSLFFKKVAGLRPLFHRIPLTLITLITLWCLSHSDKWFISFCKKPKFMLLQRQARLSSIHGTRVFIWEIEYSTDFRKNVKSFVQTQLGVYSSVILSPKPWTTLLKSRISTIVPDQIALFSSA